MRLRLLFGVPIAHLVAIAPFFASHPAAAQLSGPVNLGLGNETSAGSSRQDANSAKQILVTGIGATPESAEKQAITDAVRQAVGAYVDANTIVENEAVIKDRILSVSNGFVKEYKVVSPAKQRDDGLYELQILATVETTQVVQALKENNIISGEVEGANMWAEASTKVMNAQDAVAMLQAKIPELIKSSVTITPLGEDGKPMLSNDGTPSTAPPSVKEDAASGKANLRWYLEMGLDKKYYKQTLLPLVQKCMDAVTGVSAIELSEIMHSSVQQGVQEYAGERLGNGDAPPWPKPPASLTSRTVDIFNCGLPYKEYPVLIKSFSRSFDSYEGLAYSSKQSLVISGSPDPSYGGYDVNSNAQILCYLEVKVLDADGEVLALKKVPGWQPFVFHAHRLIAVGPNITANMNRLALFAPIVVVPKIELDLNLLKEIKSVEISLKVVDFQLSLGSN